MKVTSPKHRCEPVGLCNRYSIHIVIPGKSETLCGDNCRKWHMYDTPVEQEDMLQKRCLGHLVCLTCQHMLPTMQRKQP